MYVCLCHGITDREIRKQCTTAPRCSVAEIYSARGVAPKCGKCVAMVRELIIESREQCRAETPRLPELAFA